ncbi:MAG TPA: Hpt domain-containing protein [Candidatus Binataceae bacterium]
MKTLVDAPHASGRDQEASDSPIDIAVLKRLNQGEEHEPDFVSELIDVFLADMDDRIRAMKASLQSGQRGAIARAAHALRGSSSHFGAKRITALCASIEAQAKKDAPAGLDSIVGELEQERHRVRAALLEHKHRNSRATV